jgi:replicative DNA helicase
VKDATKTPDLIRSWWTKWPQANIGIATGRASGVVVIDVDGPEGEAALTKIGGNPPTPTSLTGKGRHAFFAAPEHPVKNAVALAEKLDVRGDGGYVVAPPSLHASGRRYRWDRENSLGPRDLEPAPLPAALAERIAKARASSGARDIPTSGPIPEGKRNQTLVSYTGRLLRKGHSLEETHALVSALNRANCQPPLSEDEVTRIVQSIASRENAIEMPAEDEAEQQTKEAIEYGRQDFSNSPKWTWGSLHRIVGPVLPGELWIVGARPSQGKTTFLLNWMEHLAVMQGVPWLFIGMEMDPKQLRRKWAAFRCGFNEEAVLTNHWTALPDGAQELIENDLQSQATEPLKSLTHFAPARRIDVIGLRRWVEFAVQRKCDLVVVDHLHRMSFGHDDLRKQMTETVRVAKELAVLHQIGLVMAAQLNRGARDILSEYHPQPLSALKDCGAIEEEADAVLMLSRCLKPGVKNSEMNAIRQGVMEIDGFVEEGAMKVMCAKHRRNSAAQKKHTTLQLDNGLLRERMVLVS